MRFGKKKEFVRSPPPFASALKTTPPIVLKMWERTRWNWVTRRDSYGGSIVALAPANQDGELYGSRTTTGMHAPCIDLDFDCELIESSTPGHYHLMLNKEVTWEAYAKLLDALYTCGFIERGWYHEAIDKKQSFVRQPGVYKQFEDLKKLIAETGDLFPSEAP